MKKSIAIIIFYFLCGSFAMAQTQCLGEEIASLQRTLTVEVTRAKTRPQRDHVIRARIESCSLIRAKADSCDYSISKEGETIEAHSKNLSSNDSEWTPNLKAELNFKREPDHQGPHSFTCSLALVSEQTLVDTEGNPLPQKDSIICTAQVSQLGDYWRDSINLQVSFDGQTFIFPPNTVVVEKKCCPSSMNQCLECAAWGCTGPECNGADTGCTGPDCTGGSSDDLAPPTNPIPPSSPSEPGLSPSDPSTGASESIGQEEDGARQGDDDSFPSDCYCLRGSLDKCGWLWWNFVNDPGLVNQCVNQCLTEVVQIAFRPIPSFLCPLNSAYFSNIGAFCNQRTTVTDRLLCAGDMIRSSIERKVREGYTAMCGAKEPACFEYSDCLEQLTQRNFINGISSAESMVVRFACGAGAHAYNRYRVGNEQYLLIDTYNDIALLCPYDKS